MPHVEPLAPEALPEDLQPILKAAESAMGYVPNSLLTMGRWPELTRAFAGLLGTVNLGGVLPRELKELVSFVASRAAGCRYCQAHTSELAARSGVPTEKVQDAFAFETSERFDERERAALRLARDAALVPPAVTDAHFEELRRHFDEREILELVAQIALFGFLNRWNDTLATELEASPLRFAREHLGTRGWDAGKHAGGGDPPDRAR